MGSRPLTVAARALFGLGLLAYVLYRLDLPQVLRSMSRPAWGALALALAIPLVGRLVLAYRWQRILQANELERSFGNLLALVFIGGFFNAFLPSAIGGDLMRGFYVARGKENMVASYGGLLLERLIGLLALVWLAGAAALAALASDSSFPARLLVSVVALAVAVTVAALVARKRLRAWTKSPASRPERRAARVLRALAQSLAAFDQPATPRSLILASSLALQLLVVLFPIACARAVGLQTPAIVFFLVVPASVIAGLLPVTLGGLGVRQGVLVSLLIQAGAPAALAGACALVALIVAAPFALAGGLVYPFYRPSSVGANAEPPEGEESN